jgi:hypothetical protein
MQNWEYKTIKLNTTGGLAGGILDIEKFDGILNELGSNGWEMVSAFDTNQSYGASRDVIAVFKRQIGLRNE